MMENKIIKKKNTTVVDPKQISYAVENSAKVNELVAQTDQITKDFDVVVANVTNGNESATNTELVLARGGETTLDVRLDKTENKLDANAKNKLLSNPAKPLNIKTYAGGKDQPTHPKVLYFENGWNEHKYWMAYTPYPKSSSFWENPCITYSDDGHVWKEDGIENPITSTQYSGCWYSDPHLVYRSDTNQIELWIRYCSNGTDGLENGWEGVYRLKSTDGVNWSEKELVYSVIDTKWESVLSPSIIYEENKYKIWICYKRECLKYFESLDGVNWQFKRNINVNPIDSPYKVWHFDIIKSNVGYEFVGCYQYNGQFDKNNFIYYAKSIDNVNYSVPKKILGNGLEGSFDDLELYRPCLIRKSNNVMLYYGAQQNKARWSIGLIESLNISNLTSAMGDIVITEKDVPTLCPTKLDGVSLKPTNVNLLDLTRLKSGGYYKWNTGNWIIGSSVYSSHAIAVHPNTRYKTKPIGTQVTFWDKNELYLSGLDCRDGIIDVPDNLDIKYMKMSLYGTLTNYMVVQGDEYPPEYIESRYKYKFDDKKYTSIDLEENSVNNSNILDVSLSKIIGVMSKNLFDKSKAVKGKYYKDNGEIANNASYSHSEFIEVSVGDYKHNTGATCIIWDLNKNCIRAIPSGSPIKINENEKYITLNIVTVELNDIMFVKGHSLPSSYIAFNEKFTISSKLFEII